jgi:hypothetical protein
MLLWLAIHVIQIGIFDQFDQAYWLFFFPQRKFRVSVEGEMSMPRVMQAGVPQGSFLSTTLFNMHINDAPQTRCVHLALFVDHTGLYATDLKEGFIVRKLQRGLSSTETWFECWNIKINEDKTQGIYFSRSCRPPGFTSTTLHVYL